MDCIFCKIIKGEIPSYKVYENDDTIAFLDVNPISRGHCLVVPKKHFENIFDIKEDSLQKTAVVGKNIASKIKENLKCEGVNFLQSNGSVAGQVIFHYHLHVIPRYVNDGLRVHKIFGERGENANTEDLKKLAEKIKF